MSSSLHLEVDFMMRGAKVLDDDNRDGDGGGDCVIAITRGEGSRVVSVGK